MIRIVQPGIKHGNRSGALNGCLQNGVTEYDESVLSVAAFHDGVLRDHYFGGSLLTSEGTETTRAGLEEWISPKV